MYVSSLEGLTLSEYIQARAEYCRLKHLNCSECKAMISIGQMVLDKGFVTLKEAYTYSYSHVQYSSFMAR